MAETAVNNVPVTVRIMDREYRIACPEGEQEDLLRAADYLNGKMREMRDGNQIVGAERVSVLTALNIANDLLRLKSAEIEPLKDVGSRIQNLRQKVEKALED